MPRKLKVYQTSLGFYDLAIAAPSMKAALKAWGASESNLFQQGFAKQTDDRQVIAAAMAKPGVVLRRPVGSNKRFQEHAELPTAESLSEHFRKTEPPRKKVPGPKPKADKKAKRDAAEAAEREAAAKADEKAERKAAAAYKEEERRRELKRQKDEAAAAKLRARRNAAIEKAKSALEEARREHTERTAVIAKDRAAVERRAKQEEMRWQKLERRLEATLQKAGR
jgi:colicin import membrane protein